MKSEMVGPIAHDGNLTDCTFVSGLPDGLLDRLLDGSLTYLLVSSSRRLTRPFRSSVAARSLARQIA